MPLSKQQKRRLFRDLDRTDPAFVEKIAPFLKGLYDHYFRCEISGWENVESLAKDEKVLFVGNHNGLLTFEVLMLFYAWWDRFKYTRRALGLAHGVAVDNPVFRWLTTRIGAIPADPDIAMEAFKRGFSLLVFPGGEKEAFRPYSERKKVDFFQRQGFVRLALNAGVPIVPIVSVGAHETYVILHRGEEIAEKLGIKDRFRLHGVPITYRGIFFAWCIVSGVFTFFPLLLAPAAFAAIFVPMPAKMTFKVLPKIDIVAMVDPNLTDKENHQKIYDYVTGVIQTAVAEEYEKRKYPIIG